LVPKASERHYVGFSRIATLLVMVLAFCAAFVMTSVGDAWKYLFNLTAGVGLVMILRWYWWRVNAWSEIAALAASALVSNAILLLHVFPATDPNAQAKTLLVTVPIATLAWIVVTFVTAPEPQERLVDFYRRVRPSGAGWGRIAQVAGPVPPGESLGIGAIDWLAGCGLVYGALFGIGKLVLGDAFSGLAYLVLSAVCFALIFRSVTRPSLVGRLHGSDFSSQVERGVDVT
jgi:solute:Na+ symporter, SSS family